MSETPAEEPVVEEPAPEEEPKLDPPSTPDDIPVDVKLRTLKAQYNAFADYLRRDIPDNDERSEAIADLEHSYQRAVAAVQVVPA